MRGAVLLALLLLLAPLGAGAYDVRYEVGILPDRGTARLSVRIVQSGGVVRSISFPIEPLRFFDETADGELTRVEEEGEPPRLVWRPPRDGGVLRYSLRVDRVREGAEYDARCASSWMVARAEDLFPPATTRFKAGSDMEANARLRFKLPPRWQVAHPYAIEDGLAVIEQEHRRLDQPKGWIVAGRLDRVRAEIEGSRISLAAPEGHGARIYDLLAFLRWTLPVLRGALGSLPERILIVSAGNPMWRGGLSAPGSVFVHADRPLIDSDASSPLLHELVHTITRARSAPGEDWIVEGLAEHYSRETLLRSGAISQKLFDDTLQALRRRGERVRRLEGEATGAETALAVAFFYDLQQQIRAATDSDAGLDPVAVTLVGEIEAIDRFELAERVLQQTGFDATRLIRQRIPALPDRFGAN